jgi:hypothetical protein
VQCSSKNVWKFNISYFIECWQQNNKKRMKNNI